MIAVESNILYLLVAIDDSYKYYFDLMDFDADAVLQSFCRYSKMYDLKDCFKNTPVVLIAINPNAKIYFFRIDLDENYKLIITEIAENSKEVQIQAQRSEEEIIQAYSDLSCGYCLNQLVQRGKTSGVFGFPEGFNIIVERPVD